MNPMADVSKQSEILTPEGRASFVNVLTPKKARKPGGEDRFELMLIFPPGTDLTELKRAAKAAAVAKFGEEEVTRLLAANKLRSPFKKAEDFDKKYEGIEPGCVVIQPWSKFAPEIVFKQPNGAITPIVTPQEFYSGCHARVMVRAFAYDTDGNKGVSFGLGNVLRTRKDKALGGRAPAEQQFKDVDVPVDPNATAAAPPASGGDGFLD